MVLVSDCGVSSSLRGFAVLLGGCTIATREETWPHSPLYPPEHISPKPGVLFIYLFHSAHIQFHQSHVLRARLQVCQLACARERAAGVLLLAKRRMWRAAACCVAALAARARVCGAASQCSRMPSLKCWHAAVCGGLQSVLPSIVQS